MMLGPLLGLVRTLDGLNLRNNCIEFPPAEIIDKGTKRILIFLRRMLKADKGGDQASGMLLAIRYVIRDPASCMCDTCGFVYSSCKICVVLS
jgi:hypothetical protein